MEKITRSPLSFLQSFGDTQPLMEEEEIVPNQLKINRFNHKHPFGRALPFEKKNKSQKKRCDHVILTDQLHEWNNFLHKKFQRKY